MGEWTGFWMFGLEAMDMDVVLLWMPCVPITCTARSLQATEACVNRIHRMYACMVAYVYEYVRTYISMYVYDLYTHTYVHKYVCI